LWHGFNIFLHCPNFQFAVKLHIHLANVHHQVAKFVLEAGAGKVKLLDCSKQSNVYLYLLVWVDATVLLVPY
jgi:hypothetical protein